MNGPTIPYAGWLFTFGLCETKPNRSSATQTTKPFPKGKGEEEGRFGEVAASPNVNNQPACGIIGFKYVSRSAKK